MILARLVLFQAERWWSREWLMLRGAASAHLRIWPEVSSTFGCCQPHRRCSAFPSLCSAVRLDTTGRYNTAVVHYRSTAVAKNGFSYLNTRHTTFMKAQRNAACFQLCSIYYERVGAEQDEGRLRTEEEANSASNISWEGAG